MTIRNVASLSAAAALTAFIASPALAQSSVKVGTLTCDVSAGIGMLITQKQTMTCSFSPADGGPPDNYVGRIDQFGLALGEVQQGTMVWGVLAPASGFPHGALAGTLRGRGRSSNRRRRPWRQPLGRRNRPRVLSAAPYGPRSVRAQLRRGRHDPDAHFGALSLKTRPVAGASGRMPRTPRPELDRAELR